MIYLSLSSGAQAKGHEIQRCDGMEKTEREALTLNSHLQFSSTLISNLLLSTLQFFLLPVVNLTLPPPNIVFCASTSWPTTTFSGGPLLPSVDDCLDRYYADLVSAEDVQRMRVTPGLLEWFKSPQSSQPAIHEKTPILLLAWLFWYACPKLITIAFLFAHILFLHASRFTLFVFILAKHVSFLG